MKIVKWLSIFGLLFGIALAAVLFHFDTKIHEPLNLSEATVFQVKAGHSAKGLLNRLKQQGIITDNIGLKIRVKFEPELANIKVGTYELLPSMSGLDLLTLFSSGKEIIKLNHEAFDRALYSDGALTAAKWLINKKPGLYSMRDLLNFK